MRNRDLSASLVKAFSICAFVFSIGLGFSNIASATQVKVTITNLAPQQGSFLTPVWVGFHDGTFDLYDIGASASPGLERVAEDGATGTLSAEFAASLAGLNSGIDATIISPGGFPGAPVLDPGESTSAMFDLDPVKNRFFSYASMVIPSNDAFIANGDPLAFPMFDAGGNFSPISFTVLGSNVTDAGTEDNTEMEAAFINQTGPDMGTATAGGVVALHGGFINSLGNPGGTPIILGGMTAAGTLVDSILGDFTQPGTGIARITIVPEPSSVMLLIVAGISLVGFALQRHFQRCPLPESY